MLTIVSATVPARYAYGAVAAVGIGIAAHTGSAVVSTVRGVFDLAKDTTLLGADLVGRVLAMTGIPGMVDDFVKDHGVVAFNVLLALFLANVFLYKIQAGRIEEKEARVAQLFAQCENLLAKHKDLWTRFRGSFLLIMACCPPPSV